MLEAVGRFGLELIISISVIKDLGENGGDMGVDHGNRPKYSKYRFCPALI